MAAANISQTVWEAGIKASASSAEKTAVKDAQKLVATVNAWLDPTGQTVAYISNNPVGLAIRRQHLMICTETNRPESTDPKMVGLPIENPSAVALGKAAMNQNLDINDGLLLQRINAETTAVTGASSTVNATTSANWVGESQTSAVYKCELIVPADADDISTTTSAIQASENMATLIAAETARVKKLTALYEEINLHKSKTCHAHGKLSMGVLDERIALLSKHQEIEREKANLVVTKRKSQATVLAADVILKSVVDEANKKTGSSTKNIGDFPAPLK